VPANLKKCPHLPPIAEMMKSYDNCLNQGITWNEFEVVARNCPPAVRIENSTLINHEWDFRVQVSNNTGVYVLDTAQVLDYTYMDDDMEHMDEFRVKKYNERFGFSIENPSDKAYCKQAAH
jgi:hypothetical protein